jgi:hypothetical protein
MASAPDLPPPGGHVFFGYVCPKSKLAIGKLVRWKTAEHLTTHEFGVSRLRVLNNILFVLPFTPIHCNHSYVSVELFHPEQQAYAHF